MTMLRLRELIARASTNTPPGNRIPKRSARRRSGFQREVAEELLQVHHLSGDELRANEGLGAVVFLANPAQHHD